MKAQTLGFVNEIPLKKSPHLINGTKVAAQIPQNMAPLHFEDSIVTCNIRFLLSNPFLNIQNNFSKYDTI